MQKLQITPAIILLSLLLFSCSKDGKESACVGPNLGWNLYGYDTSQLSVFYLNTYEKGTHFATQLSHTVSGTAFHRDSVYGPDTVAYEVNFYAHPFPEEFGGQIDAQYDYEFVFPLAGRTFQLRDIVIAPSTGKYERESGVMCRSAFSYYLNDTLKEVPVGTVSNKASMPTIISFSF